MLADRPVASSIIPRFHAPRLLSLAPPSMRLPETPILPCIGILLFPRSQPACSTGVEIALQNHRRGHGIDLSLAPSAPVSALSQCPFRHGRRQSLVPELDRCAWL